jgi:hypothetical protein
MDYQDKLLARKWWDVREIKYFQNRYTQGLRVPVNITDYINQGRNHASHIRD